MCCSSKIFKYFFSIPTFSPDLWLRHSPPSQSWRGPVSVICCMSKISNLWFISVPPQFCLHTPSLWQNQTRKEETSVPITSRVPIVSWLQYVGKTVSSHGLLTEYWCDEWSHMWCDDWDWSHIWCDYQSPVSGVSWPVDLKCVSTSLLILFICFSFHKPYQLISALKKRIMIIISAGLMLRVSQ